MTGRCMVRSNADGLRGENEDREKTRSKGYLQ